MLWSSQLSWYSARKDVGPAVVARHAEARLIDVAFTNAMTPTGGALIFSMNSPTQGFGSLEPTIGPPTRDVSRRYFIAMSVAAGVAASVIKCQEARSPVPWLFEAL